MAQSKNFFRKTTKTLTKTLLASASMILATTALSSNIYADPAARVTTSEQVSLGGFSNNQNGLDNFTSQVGQDQARSFDSGSTLKLANDPTLQRNSLFPGMIAAIDVNNADVRTMTLQTTTDQLRNGFNFTIGPVVNKGAGAADTHVLNIDMKAVDKLTFKPNAVAKLPGLDGKESANGFAIAEADKNKFTHLGTISLGAQAESVADNATPKTYVSHSEITLDDGIVAPVFNAYGINNNIMQNNLVNMVNAIAGKGVGIVLVEGGATLGTTGNATVGNLGSDTHKLYQLVLKGAEGKKFVTHGAVKTEELIFEDGESFDAKAGFTVDRVIAKKANSKAVVKISADSSVNEAFGSSDMTIDAEFTGNNKNLTIENSQVAVTNVYAGDVTTATDGQGTITLKGNAIKVGSDNETDNQNKFLLHGNFGASEKRLAALEIALNRNDAAAGDDNKKYVEVTLDKNSKFYLTNNINLFSTNSVEVAQTIIGHKLVLSEGTMIDIKNGDTFGFINGNSAALDDAPVVNGVVVVDGNSSVTNINGVKSLSFNAAATTPYVLTVTDKLVGANTIDFSVNDGTIEFTGNNVITLHGDGVIVAGNFKFADNKDYGSIKANNLKFKNGDNGQGLIVGSNENIGKFATDDGITSVKARLKSVEAPNASVVLSGKNIAVGTVKISSSEKDAGLGLSLLKTDAHVSIDNFEHAKDGGEVALLSGPTQQQQGGQQQVVVVLDNVNIMKSNGSSPLFGSASNRIGVVGVTSITNVTLQDGVNIYTKVADPENNITSGVFGFVAAVGEDVPNTITLSGDHVIDTDFANLGKIVTSGEGKTLTMNRALQNTVELKDKDVLELANGSLIDGKVTVEANNSPTSVIRFTNSSSLITPEQASANPANDPKNVVLEIEVGKVGAIEIAGNDIAFTNAHLDKTNAVKFVNGAANKDKDVMAKFAVASNVEGGTTTNVAASITTDVSGRGDLVLYKAEGQENLTTINIGNIGANDKRLSSVQFGSGVTLRIADEKNVYASSISSYVPATVETGEVAAPGTVKFEGTHVVDAIGMDGKRTSFDAYKANITSNAMSYVAGVNKISNGSTVNFKAGLMDVHGGKKDTAIHFEYNEAGNTSTTAKMTVDYKNNPSVAMTSSGRIVTVNNEQQTVAFGNVELKNVSELGKIGTDANTGLASVSIASDIEGHVTHFTENNYYAADFNMSGSFKPKVASTFHGKTSFTNSTIDLTEKGMILNGTSSSFQGDNVFVVAFDENGFIKNQINVQGAGNKLDVSAAKTVTFKVKVDPLKETVKEDIKSYLVLGDDNGARSKLLDADGKQNVVIEIDNSDNLYEVQLVTKTANDGNTIAFVRSIEALNTAVVDELTPAQQSQLESLDRRTAAVLESVIQGYRNVNKDTSVADIVKNEVAYISESHSDTVNNTLQSINLNSSSYANEVMANLVADRSGVSSGDSLYGMSVNFKLGYVIDKKNPSTHSSRTDNIEFDARRYNFNGALASDINDSLHASVGLNYTYSTCDYKADKEGDKSTGHNIALVISGVEQFSKSMVASGNFVVGLSDVQYEQKRNVVSGANIKSEVEAIELKTGYVAFDLKGGFVHKFDQSFSAGVMLGGNYSYFSDANADATYDKASNLVKRGIEIAARHIVGGSLEGNVHHEYKIDQDFALSTAIRVAGYVHTGTDNKEILSYNGFKTNELARSSTDYGVIAGIKIGSKHVPTGLDIYGSYDYTKKFRENRNIHNISVNIVWNF